MIFLKALFFKYVLDASCRSLVETMTHAVFLDHKNIFIMKLVIK